MHNQQRSERTVMLCGAVSLLALPAISRAVVGVDYNPAIGIDAVAVLNNTITASSLYSAKTFTPTFGGFTFTVPFNSNYGHGSVVAVVDIGLVDNTNPALTKASTYFNINLPTNPSSLPPANLVGDHATAVAEFAAGYNSTTTDNLVGLVGFGIAPLATLWSGSIVDSGDPNSDTNIQTTASTLYPFVQAMQVGVNGVKADVVNASIGAPNVPASDDFFSAALDGLATQNPRSTLVIAAGNDGSASGTVGSPAVSFNSISVAALASDPSLTFNQASDYSSRGPQDFYNPVTGVTLRGVRPAVDIAAPGDYFVISATPVEGEPNNYELSIGAGTSFATPLVSGAVAQLTAYAHGLSNLASGLRGLDPNINQRISDATDGRVVKAVLLNSADRTPGWNNASVINGVLSSTLGLDNTVGAGRLNVSRAADNYLNGNFDPQVIDTEFVGPKGWDLSTVIDGQPNFYDLGTFTAGDSLSVTLNWFADDTYDADSLTASINGFTNLNLEVLEILSSGQTREVAISDALYNNVQLLSFRVDDTAEYEIEVLYAGVQYGTDTGSEQYALVWSNAAVPEPSGLFSLAPAALSLRRSKKLRIQKNRRDLKFAEGL